MAYEYAMVTPQPWTRQGVSAAVDALGQRVTVGISDSEQLSIITAQNGVALCQVYSSLPLSLPTLDGYGEIPIGMGYCAAVTLHSGSGRIELDYAQRLAAQLGGTLLAPVPIVRKGSSTAGSRVGASSDSGDRATTGWSPARSDLPVSYRHLHKLSFAEADALYELKTAPLDTIASSPSILFNAASNPSIIDRIALVTALLDRGVEAGTTDEEGTNVLHVLFRELRGDIELQLPLIKRLISEGADPRSRSGRFGSALGVLQRNGRLSDEEGAPLYDYLNSLGLEGRPPNRGQRPLM